MYEGTIDPERSALSTARDPGGLLWTSKHKHLLKALETAIRCARSSVLLLGEAGVGKTTLVRRLLEVPPADLAIGYLDGGAHRNVPASAVVAAFGAPAAAGSHDEAWDIFAAFMRECGAAGGRAALIVDAADQVTASGYETLRRLVDRGSSGDAPLTLILVGQPRLGRALGKARFRGLPGRSAVAFRLNAMSPEETAALVRERLQASRVDPDALVEGAIAAVHHQARGVPRHVNSICDQCLTAARRRGVQHVDAALVEMIAAGARPAAEEGADPSPTDVGFRALESNWEGEAPFELMDPSDFVLFFGRDRENAVAPIDTRFRTLVGRALAAVAGRGQASLRTVRGAFGDGADGTASWRSRVLAVAPPQVVLAGVATAGIAIGVLSVVLLWQDGSPLTARTPGDELPVHAAAGSHGSTANRLQPEYQVALAGMAPPDPDGGNRLFREALSATDPSTAAVTFARAAVRGHSRAAYYLAQLYESGDGVPLDVELARAWYVQASDVAHARRRLAELPPPGGMRAGDVPLPVFAGRSRSGEIDLVWSGSPDGDPPGFVVELSRDPVAGAESWHFVAASAVRLAVPPAVPVWWRVSSGADAGAASRWQFVHFQE